jgi:hypothetical protein
VTEPLQATDEGAAYGISVQAVEIVGSELLVILLSLEDVIRHHQHRVRHSQYGSLASSPGGQASVLRGKIIVPQVGDDRSHLT